MRIYLDACVIIYLVEGQQPFERRVAERLQQLRIGPSPLILTSRLSRLECRTRPLREGNTALLAGYETFFAPADLRLSEISAAIIEHATDLRAHYGFKTPEAIPLATTIYEWRHCPRSLARQRSHLSRMLRYRRTQCPYCQSESAESDRVAHRR